VNVSVLLQGVGHEHILQYAIDINHLDFVSALCDAGADVNLGVRIRKYFKVSLPRRFFKSLFWLLLELLILNLT
jgi:ankyrin repeat protein